MMNLSINLTLGSPGAESVLNTAPADSEAADSFSQTLAEELSGQELTASVRLEDTQATEPVMLDLIATRQQLATDGEIVTGKNGQIWLDDPIAGMSDATATEAEAAELISAEKPWFDIIEKAKNYSPAMQANKTAAESAFVDVAAAELQTQDASTAGATLPLADAASMLTDALSPAQTGTVASTPESESPLAPELLPVQQMMEVTDAAVKTAESTTSSVVAEPAVPQTQVTPELTPGHQVSGSTDSALVIAKDAPVVVAQNTVAAAKQAEVVTPAAGSARAETDEVATATVLNQQQAVVLPTASAETAVATVQHAKPQHAEPQHAEQKGATGQGSAASETVVAPQQVVPDSVQQTAVLTDTLAATISRPAPSGSADKAPAANAFAEHLKSVNQNQLQQQQQPGAEQQPGQGQTQAKANTETLAANVPAAGALTAPLFAQQLQQASETPASTVPATPAPGHVTAATSSHATLLSARPADTTPWQAPLALADPSAAQQLKDRVMVQIQQKLQTAEVQLHPEDLGTMQIKLNLQQDQLSVQFIVQQGAAKEALEQQMPRLRDMLEQQGIALTEGQVEQRQSGSQQEHRQTRSGHADGADTDAAVKQQVQIRVSDRMVDFYA